MSEIDLNIRFNHNKKYINGPFNVVRLEGKIDGITKVVYLFMDFHKQIGYQTKCDNIYAIDLSTYLAETFYKISNSESGRKYDFFYEIFPKITEETLYDLHYHTNINFVGRYIDEVSKLFDKIFSYDQEKNIVSISSLFKNIRLHYTDVRIFFIDFIYSYFHILNQLMGEIYVSRIFQPYYVESINHMVNNIVDRYKILITLMDDFLSGKNIPYEKAILIDRRPFEQQECTDNQPEKRLNTQKYIFDKLFNKYHSSKIRNEMRAQLKISRDKMEKMIPELNNFMEKINDIAKKYGKKFILNKHENEYIYGINMREYFGDCAIIYPMLRKINSNEADIEMIFMDIFFLRRFLDKDYITNAIVYTGASHSYYYIEMLVQKFNFRITHASYATITNMNELNKQVMQSDLDGIEKIFYPSVMVQCSDLSHFPSDFL